MKKYIYITLGLVFVGLGFLGVFLPGIPTTPFVILSAWLFSRSSKYLENWLINHNVFGQLILDWRKHQGIKRKSKLLAIFIIIPTFTFSTLSFSNIYLKILFILFCIVLCTYIISRPEPPKVQNT